MNERKMECGHDRSAILEDPEDDKEVRYGILPEYFSPLVELWYFTNATLAKRRSRRQNLHRPTVYRNYSFFTLAVFKHIYQTWLVQAGCLKLRKSGKGETEETKAELGDTGSIHNTHEIPTIKEMARSCDALFDEHFPDLPKYVTQFLTKLFLLMPEFMEKSLYMRYLFLHKGEPLYLGHGREFLSDFRARNFPRNFKPHFSLEIIADEAQENQNYNGILFLLNPQECCVWVGTVTEFPQCLHTATHALKIIDTNLSLCALKEQLSELNSAFEQALTSDNVNSKHLRRQLFPGVCYMIHRKKRVEVCERLNSEIKRLVRKIHSFTAGRLSIRSELATL